MELSKPFQGDVVWVEADGRTWRYYRCAICGHQLSDARSTVRGYGPDCLREHGREECERRLRGAVGADRRRFTNRLDVERILARPGRVDAEDVK